MTDFVTQLFTSCQELTKYYVIRNVVTGDKTLDNLLSATILLLIGYAFKVDLWRTIYKKLSVLPVPERVKTFFSRLNAKPDEPVQYYKNTKYVKIPKHKHKEYLAKYFDADTYNTVSWNGGGNFADAMVHFMIDEFPYTTTKQHLDFDKDFSIVGKAYITLAMRAYFTDTGGNTYTGYIPMFLNKDELVVFKYNPNDWGYYICYKSQESLTLFRDLVLTYLPQHIDIMKKYANKSEIFTIDYKDMSFVNTKTTIYPDRTMDTYISRYKNQIISLLDNFKKVNEVNKYNPGSYNLGFMLYGAPGCGKTLLSKVIANYLKRHIIIVDMRNIKTKTQFEKLFTDYAKHIYIFDEFDCVQGVLSRDRLEEKSPIHDEKTALKQMRLDLMMKLHETVDDTLRKGIEKAIIEVDEKLTLFKDKLTLDTILTVLDGIKEMRGRVIIANTNYIDRIDAALLREGRFDLKLHLTEFNDEETKELLCQMFPGAANKELIYSHKYIEGKYSPTTLMNICTKHKDLATVIDMLKINMLKVD